MTTSRSLETRLGAAIAVALLAACSSFEADTRPGSDAGAADGGGGMPEASTSTTTDSGSACGSPLLVESFATTENPAGWAQPGDSTGTIEVTAAPYLDAQGNYLHARVTNSGLVGKPPTLIGPSIAVAKHVRLEYDLAVQKAEHYGELGCELQLWGPTVGEDLVKLFIGIERTAGVSLITGWDYKTASAGQTSDESSVLTGWQVAKWQHVVMDVTIDGSQVTMEVSIDGGLPTAIHPPTAAYAFKEMHVRCGILYLSPEPDGVEQTMDVGIDNIKVESCVPP